MKILISLTNLQIGGAQMFAIQLAQALIKKKHHVIIYSHQSDYDVLNVSDIKIFSLKKLGILNTILWKINGILSKLHIYSRFYETINFYYFKLVIKFFRPHVISSHMSYSDKIISQISEKILKKYLFIPTLHGEYELGLSETTVIENIKKKSKGIIYTSDKNIALFHDYANPLRKIGIGLSSNFIENYLNKITKNDLNIPENDFVFGMVARAIPEKGWKNLIECFIELNTKYNHITLLLIGTGQYLKDLVQLYQHPKIKLLQFNKNPFDFFSYLPLIDVGVLPTYFAGESFPNILIQYIYFDKPVIASNIGEISNIISWKNEKCGILLELHSNNINNKDLSEAMEKMLQPSEYNKYKSIASKKKYEFDIKQIADEYESFFKKLMYE